MLRFEKGTKFPQTNMDIQHTDMASPVENMTSHICLHVMASSLHSHTSDDEDQHDEKALNTAKNIDDFGNEKRDTATQCGRHYARNGQQSVCPKG